jgi:uncharacterized protein (DUF952 family)
MLLFHLVEPSTWAEAVEAGVYAPPSLQAEGFVHFSFAEQVTGTANLRYRDVPELVVVEIDTEGVGAELRIEDTYGSGAEFPHVYGPIPTTAAVDVHPIVRTPEGDWAFTPAGDAAGPA